MSTKNASQLMPLARRLFHDGAAAVRSTVSKAAAVQQTRSYGATAQGRRKTPFASNSGSLSPSPSPKSPGGKVEKKPAAPKQWNQGYLSFLESKSASQSLRAEIQ